MQNLKVKLFSLLGTNYRVMVRALMVDGTSVSRQQFFETSEAGKKIFVVLKNMPMVFESFSSSKS